MLDTDTRHLLNFKKLREGKDAQQETQLNLLTSSS